MNKNEYVFQTGWEVCNKVGGIYTVLSTVAASLVNNYKNNLFFIGPDFHIENHPVFTEDKNLMPDFKEEVSKYGIGIRLGYWEVPGRPQVILVDYNTVADKKGEFLYKLWAEYSIDSMNTNQDYENSVMFSYAAARVIEIFADKYNINREGTVAQWHEWQTAAGLLYLKMNHVGVKTLFTTHATTVGRSICFNGKLLYQYFDKYNGDQMSYELGVVAQHAIEKHGALKADCFTTVSKLTAKECLQLLSKAPDVVTPNGFEAGFVPKADKFDKARKDARKSLRTVAEALLGYKTDDNALYVGIGGRLEYRNKGIDVFLESMKALNQDIDLNRQIVAFVMVPDWIEGPRKDLKERLDNPKQKFQLSEVHATHQLHQPQYDAVMQGLGYFQLNNNESDRVKVIFVDALLDGQDGIFNKTYYDLLIGLDMTVFPSYYEPWGYTPMESVAFSIPTITTNLTGFGLWVSEEPTTIENGVAVLYRNDQNRQDVVENIKSEIKKFALKDEKEVSEIRAKAKAIADKGQWKDFVKYYEQAFAFAKGVEYKPSKSATKASSSSKNESKSLKAESPAAESATKKTTSKKSCAKKDSAEKPKAEKKTAAKKATETTKKK